MSIPKQGKTDSRNPKFRILCRYCNSYIHTRVELSTGPDNEPEMLVICDHCGNEADDFTQEWTHAR